MISNTGLKWLLTNLHIITEDLINKEIKIILYNGSDVNIKLNKRYIHFYRKLDITVMEIKESDNIIKDIDFLEYDLSYVNGYDKYENIDAFSLQYPKNKIEYGSGKILKILNNYEFTHNIDTENGSSGSPIILHNSLKVIGIHKQGDILKPVNYGTFIGELFNNKNKDISSNNYIIGEIYISKDDINKDIRIINSYEEYLRNKKLEIKQYINEEEIKECIIEINNENYPFSYTHKFDKEGKYIIKYIFKNILLTSTYMFANCLNIINLDLSNFNTEKIINMSCMFLGCASLKNLNLSNINTINVINISKMFSFCSSLTNLDLYNLNTANVSDMSYLFCGCSSLKDLNLFKFNTKNVTSMICMFSHCSSLINLNLFSFNIQNVTNIMGIFSYCSSLIEINLSNFDTNKVENMSCMFLNCSSLKNIDLSKFNTENVTNMCGMFSGCSCLTNLNLSKFITKNVTNMSQMFLDCSCLTKFGFI